MPVAVGIVAVGIAEGDTAAVDTADVVDMPTSVLRKPQPLAGSTTQGEARIRRLEST